MAPLSAWIVVYVVVPRQVIRVAKEEEEDEEEEAEEEEEEEEEGKEEEEFEEEEDRSAPISNLRHKITVTAFQQAKVREYFQNTAKRPLNVTSISSI